MKQKIVKKTSLKEKSTQRNISVMKVKKKKDTVSLRKFIAEDLLFFKHDFRNIYQAFYSVYTAVAP